jgi:epoxyqueuosine reductase
MNIDSTYEKTNPAVPLFSPTGRSSLNKKYARGLALECGFSEAGLVSLPHPAEPRDAARFHDWIQAGRAGSMRYLERTDENDRLVRSRPAIPFPWAQSALVCLANYHGPQPLSTAPAPAETAWIARYAQTSRTDPSGQSRPSDYHKVLLKRLRALQARLHANFGPFESRAYVDTGPVVERSLAVAAGLGWTGKNTCLIHPRLGSFSFLAVLLTSLPVQEANAPTALIPDRCGTCRRCIDACPTDALIAPYQMDATRCISYLTIEHKGPIAEDFLPGIGRQIFGCDICQDVCPWNRKAPIAADPDLASRPELVNPTLEWLAQLDEPAFERHFNGSPLRRAGFAALQRNIAIAMGNSGRRRFAPHLQQCAQSANYPLRAAARWALDKLHALREAPEGP